MQVYTTENDSQSLWDEGLSLHRTAVALGGFDAMHIGHRAIIQKVVERAKTEGLTSAVYLFRNQPKAVVAGGAIPQVCAFEKRLEILASMGVDAVIAEWFTPEYQTVSPEHFVTEYIKNRMDARYVAVGFNYRFGCKATGDAELLKKLCLPLGITTDTVAAVEVDGETVSSSRIRELIQLGRISDATRCLGRQFTFCGSVVAGNQLGRTIGVPTANLAYRQGLLFPKFGVYLTKTRVGDVWYPSITNVGARPTVTDSTPWVETHLLDYQGDLYEQEIEVAFYEYLRDIAEFSCLDALKNQLDRDIEKAKQYFIK